MYLTERVVLRLGAGVLVHGEQSHRAHLPTGIVTVANIVHCAIVDFQVEPRRDDWASIIAAN